MKQTDRVGGVLLLCLLASAGCGEEELEFIEPPQLTVAPNEKVPLAAELAATTNFPSRISVTIESDGRAMTVAFDELGEEHLLPVLGFLPDTTHTVTVIATDDDDRSAVWTDLPAVVTDPVPDDFVDIEVSSANRAAMEPGYTLFNASSFLVALDDTGQVVWYYDDPTFPEDARRLPDGTLLVQRRDHLGALEIDMVGNKLTEWHPANSTDGRSGSIPIAIDSMHHEVLITPNGTLLGLSSELRSYADYPTSETDPTPRAEPLNVVGDVAVEANLDGSIVHEWKMLDILDPYRVGYDSFGDFWNEFYDAEGGGADWSHGNAVIPDPAGGVIVSLRHQDAIVKIDDDDQIVWILGPHENWSAEFQPYLLDPVGELAWNYHQHAPTITPDGTLLFFDNGNHRASPPDTPLDPSYSRALEVEIDEQAMEVRQVWSYDAGENIFAGFLGDADWMPETGNVLVNFGSQSRIIEVTHATPAQVVFDLTISPNTVYRVERLPSLYPPGTTVTFD